MQKQKKIRYAVVGLGYISQAAVLPAFQHAKENSEVTALISDDLVKLQKLCKKYHVKNAYLYEQYEECLRSGEIDAIYIALPNHLHREYTIRAARAGIHVLCEKPMALTEAECLEMISEAEKHGVKLMVAYRLHFEAANLQALKIVTSKKLGDPRIFQSSFTMQVEKGNIRLKQSTGGGTLYDMGIYCINAARNLFKSEPIEVSAFFSNNGQPRFGEVEEMVSAILRFPEGRLASFTCSFGAEKVSCYRVIGTKGNLLMDPAYELSGDLKQMVTIGDKCDKKTFKKKDQFAPELIHFSDCILKGKNPKPSGQEGLADIRIIRALYCSAATGRAIRLNERPKEMILSPEQEMKRPLVRKPELIHATAP